MKTNPKENTSLLYGLYLANGWWELKALNISGEKYATVPPIVSVLVISSDTYVLNPTSHILNNRFS